MVKKSIDYKKIYDTLYNEFRYHAMGKNHGKQFSAKIVRNYKFESILDVGCSNGLTVQAFQRNSKRAYGIDVSEIAIRHAIGKWVVPNCVQANVMDIPYKDNYFDAVFSCDVLEHLHPKDLIQGIREMSRVTKKYLFISVSCKEEENKEHINKMKMKYPEFMQGIKNLHLSIYTKEEWIDMISRECNAIHIADEKEMMIFEKRN